MDDLLAHGYQDITVLDVSQIAIDVTKRRFGGAAEQVHWLVADITNVQLATNAYDVWHDHAVFHFLTVSEQRAAYVRQVANVVRPGGHVIVSTFGPGGPTKCIGLDVVVGCTNSSACHSVWWKVPKKYTKLRLGPRSSFSIATAVSNDWSPRSPRRSARRTPYTIRPRLRESCEIHLLHLLHTKSALREHRRNIAGQV